MNPLTAVQQHLTASERIAEALRAAIASGELPAGAAVRQEEVAAQYRVSRMPVRDAFRQLEAEGLLVIYPSRGAFVTSLAPDEVQQIYEIRILLESEALRRAWAGLSPATLERAEAILRRLDTEDESTAWSRLDEAFHATLYGPSERPRLLSLIEQMRRQVNHLFYLTHPPEEYRADIQKEHRQILAACRAGQAERAIARLVEHLQHSADVVAAARAQAQEHGRAYGR